MGERGGGREREGREGERGQKFILIWKPIINLAVEFYRNNQDTPKMNQIFGGAVITITTTSTAIKLLLEIVTVRKVGSKYSI